jgi:protein involved in temperature-dependent protein secretion
MLPAADAYGEALDESLQAGDLRVAYDLALASLPSPPSPPSPSLQALCVILATQLERFDDAEATLDALASAHPSWRGQAQALSVCLTLSRELVARRADPDATERAALDPPPPYAHTFLAASLAFARGDATEAAALLQPLRLPLNPGRLTTTAGRALPFTSIQDPDALCGPLLIACGPLYVIDVPFDTLRALVIDPPASYHDQLWPVARLQTHSQKSLTVRLSARYPGAAAHPDPSIRLGLTTAFEDRGGVCLGVGARALRITRLDGGHEDIPLSQVARIDL